MQTPQGFSIENGIIIPTDWWAIVFNPSFPYRFAHMAVAAFLAGKLPFIAISQLIDTVLTQLPMSSAHNLDTILQADQQARALAQQKLSSF